MSADNTPTAEIEQLMQTLLDDQRAGWQQGNRTCVEDYLKRFPSLTEHPNAQLDLIYNEIVLREELGETPRLEECLQRFPHLTDPLRDQFAVHVALKDSAVGASTLLGSDPHDWRPRRSVLMPPPSVIGGCEILDEVGRGGMGVVYRARQTQLKRLVAVKMILDAGFAGEEQHVRFRQEAEIVAQLLHPNVVQIHDFGEHEGCPYFVMELVEGSDLARRLSAGPLPPHTAAELVETLARTMQTAHERGVIHRDLKPANVLLTADGTPKITDFGLARHLTLQPASAKNLKAPRDDAATAVAHEARAGLSEGAIMGTPSYVAPEQVKRDVRAVGPVTDVYALGAVLYECLTGRPPFQAATLLETLLQVLKVDPVSVRQLQPVVPKDLETICLKCLRKEPDKRYASTAELAEDLRRFRSHEPIRARPIGALERTRKWMRRRPLVAALSCLLAFVVLGALSVTTVLWLRAERDHRRAEDNRQRAEKNFQLALRTTDAIRHRVREIKEDFGTNTLVLNSLLGMMDANLQLLREVDDSPQVRELRAETLFLKAGLFLARGRTDLALPIARSSRDLYEQLSKNQREQTAAIAGLQQATRLLGEIYYEQGKSTEALAQFRAALRASDELLAQDANRQDWREDRAHNLHLVSRTLEEQAYEAEAHKALDESLAMRKRMLEQAQERVTGLKAREANANLDGARADLADAERLLALHRRRFAQSLGLWANRLYYDGNRAEALKVYRQRVGLYRGLTAQLPSSLAHQKNLAAACADLAYVLYERGEGKEAQALFDEAVRLADALHLFYPGNADLAQLHVHVRFYRSEALPPGGEPIQGIRDQIETLKSLLPLFHQFADRDPGNAKWQERLALSRLLVAYSTASLVKKGMLPVESLKPWIPLARSGVATRKRLCRSDPESRQMVSGLATAHRLMAQVERVAGSPNASAEHNRAGEQVLVDFYERRHRREPASVHWKKELVRSRAMLANALFLNKKNAAAIEERKKAVALAQTVPASPAWNRELADLHAMLGDYYPLTSAEYLNCHQKAFTIRQQLANDDNDNFAVEKELLKSYEDLALGLKHQKRFDESKKLLDEARARRLKIAAVALATFKQPDSKQVVVSSQVRKIFYNPTAENRVNDVIAICRQLFAREPSSDSALQLVNGYLSDVVTKDVAKPEDKNAVIERLEQIVKVYDDLRKAQGSADLLIEEQHLAATARAVLAKLKANKGN